MIEINEIMSYLPHKYPFLLVDRVVALEKGASIVCIKNVTYNEEFFQGHFPGNPIMPGVLIVEAMAQASGILVFQTIEEKYRGVYFMSIERAKFRKPVVPGDQLRLEARVTQHRGKVWKFSGTAFVEDKVVAEAEYTAMIVDEGS